MKLFLSSQDFGNHSERLLELVTNKKVLFINNAKDELSKNERRENSEAKKEDFESLGFNFEEVDLRDYFSSPIPDSLLTDVGLVWFSGGNTFILRRALAYSGLDKVIIKLVKEDKVVFGGSSAGSIIACPTLRGTENGDDPYAVPVGYKKEIIWDGLNLVDFYIVPHYLSDWFGKKANAMKDYFEKNKLPQHALVDGQVIVVNGKEHEFLK